MDRQREAAVPSPVLETRRHSIVTCLPPGSVIGRSWSPEVASPTPHPRPAAASPLQLWTPPEHGVCRADSALATGGAGAKSQGKVAVKGQIGLLSGKNEVEGSVQTCPVWKDPLDTALQVETGWGSDGSAP